MTAATAPAPLPMIRCDSLWDHDFEFQGEDLTGRAVAFTLVAIGRPRVGVRFEQGDGVQLARADRIAVRLLPAQLTGLRAGDYAFQVQAAIDGADEPLLVGRVPVHLGLGAYLDHGSPPLWDDVGDPISVPCLVVSPPGPTRIVRAGAMRGTPGLSAYHLAVSRGFIGTEQDWLDSLNGAFGLPVAIRGGSF